jgi:hypothetical protein
MISFSHEVKVDVLTDRVSALSHIAYRRNEDALLVVIVAMRRR